MPAWNAIEWTPDMLAFLKENFNTKTNKLLAQELGLKVTSVQHKCYELNLYKMRLEYWNAEQIQFLKDNYKTIGDTEIAEIFNSKYSKNKGWTKKHIEKKRRYLKLKRTTQEIKAIREGWRKKGLYAESVRKMWQTRGTNALGTIVIWEGEKYIKTKNRYLHLRVFNYRVFIGKIPKGMLVRHKDNDQMNCFPENLELVTREQHARLNVYNSFSKYPEDLRTLIRFSRALKRQINKIEKQQ